MPSAVFAVLKMLMPAPSPKPVAASRLKPSIVLRMPRTTGLTSSLPLKAIPTAWFLPTKRLLLGSCLGDVGRLATDHADEFDDLHRRLLQIAVRPAGVLVEEEGV